MEKGIAFKKIKLPNGETYAYREKGSGGETLVLIHGNLSSSVFWDTFMEKLDEYKVIALDLRGFGDSTYHKPIGAIKDFAEDLKEFADALGLKPFILAGWSLGGLVAQQFAADYQEYTAKLVLIASTAKAVAIPKRGLGREPIPGAFLSTREDMEMINADILKTLADRDRDKLRSGLNMMIYNKTEPEPQRYERYLDAVFQQRNKVDVDCAVLKFNITHVYNGLSDGTGEVDKIICPTLVLHGENDLVVPRVHGEHIAAGIGDNAKLAVFPGAGHSPFTDCLDALVKTMEGFINN